MDITLHQLAVFNKVCEHGSVTKAAHDLHMTQPAVSNILRLLQERVGARLIEVANKKLLITEAGKILLQAHEAILYQLQEAKTSIHLLQGGVVGTIKISSVTTAKYFVPRLLGAFKQSFPKIHIELKIRNRLEIVERLKKNLDDFVIMSQLPDFLEIDSQDFYQDQLVVAASSRHPMVGSKKLKIKDLEHQPWLIREVGSGTRMAMEKLFKMNQVTPSIEMEIDNNESIKQAIIGNIGISILSRQSISIEEQLDYIKVLDVIEFPVLHKWYLVKRKGKNLSTIANAFYQYVQSHSDLTIFN